MWRCGISARRTFVGRLSIDVDDAVTILLNVGGAITLDFIEIEIVNWELYNPKTDQLRHPNWFRLSKDIAGSQGLTGLNASERWIWVLLLAERCKKRSKIVQVNLAWLADASRMSTEDVIMTIKKLIKNNTISTTVSGLTVNCQSTHRLEHTGQNRTLQDTTTSSKEEVCSIAQKRSRTTIRVTNFEELMRAVDDQTVWSQWVDLYDHAFVRRESNKAVVWLLANPAKAKKTQRGWIQFMANWFDRGWDKSTTRGPSNSAPKSDWISAAERVFASLRLTGAAEREKALGLDLYTLARKIGFHNIGQMPNNDFSVKSLAGKLKAQYENLQEKAQ